MTSIKLTLTGAQAWASTSGPLTSGMVGIPVTIEYDDAWDGLTKNLMCRCSPWGSNDGEIRTLLNVGDTSTVAHEVMQPNMYLYLGVEGFNNDGALVIPTTWARCGIIEYGANTGEDLSADPELPIWNQLQTEVEQIKRDGYTQEQIDEIQAYVRSASQAATSAEKSKNNATAASNLAISNANVAEIYMRQAQTSAENASTSASSAANLANGALQAQRAAEAAAERAETVAGSGAKVSLPVDESGNPVYGTAGQHAVSDGKGGIQWVAESDEGGDSEESEDILLGTLPMTISESNCYLQSETNATISTGEGAAQLLDFHVHEPYLSGYPTYNGGAFEVLGKNTVKVSFEDLSKNAVLYFPIPVEAGKTYTVAAQVVAASSDAVLNGGLYIRIDDKYVIAQVNFSGVGVRAFKTFDFGETNIATAYISFTKNEAYTVGETYVTVEVLLFEGEYTELPAGTTFDILAGEKYPTDGYMGATLSAVNGETVQVFKVDTSDSESETDNGGVIFFGDSILDYSDVITRYAAKTGKSVIDCAVGGTRMSASRDSSNAYYPLDMANIADAIKTGDFSAQLGTSVTIPSGFATLASGNIANYKAIVLEFGTNDFTAKVPFEGDDATSIAGAVRHILTTILTKYPNMRIVVLSTLQYVTLGTGTESGVPTHDDGTVWQMNEVIRDVCESDEFCVPWVDMYHAFGQNGITRNTLTSDGVHLTSPNGAKRYADILVAELNALGI